MGDDSKTPPKGEGTVTSLKRFVRVCVRQGKTLAEARDALFVANLDKKLVDRALEATLFDKTSSTHIFGKNEATPLSLDFKDAETHIPTETTVPSRKVVAKKAAAAVRFKKASFESVELASTPFFSRARPTLCAEAEAPDPSRRSSPGFSFLEVDAPLDLRHRGPFRARLRHEEFRSESLAHRKGTHSDDLICHFRGFDLQDRT